MTAITTSLTFADLMHAVAHRLAVEPRPSRDEVKSASPGRDEQNGRSSPSRDQTSSADLVPRLRHLCTLAQHSGVPEQWINESADLIVAGLLSSQQLERDKLDPRRARSNAQAASLARSFKDMRRAGFTPGDAVAALRERTGLSRSRMYGLLKISKSYDFAGQKTG